LAADRVSDYYIYVNESSIKKILAPFSTSSFFSGVRSEILPVISFSSGVLSINYPGLRSLDGSKFMNVTIVLKEIADKNFGKV
jgi:hypothetical protein